jgi:C-terminal processing protease CtpA/Prc
VGAQLAGSGTVWIDDLQLLVDGKPVPDLEVAEPVKTVFDIDNEFDTGSHIALSTLSEVQIDNVWTLGKVWGFLKYHHPAVVGGKYHFDYEMIRVLPRVLAAKDRQSGNAVIEQWVTGLGKVDRCRKCTRLKGSDVALGSDLSWIYDRRLLGASLSSKLKRIYEDRPGGDQFYASMRWAGQVGFDHEPDYRWVKFPDSGFQLLALFRFWNIIEYWYPYRNLEPDWDQVLRDSILPIASADSTDVYKHELFVLIAKVHDTHANLWSSLDARPPVGDCLLPVSLRFIDDALVVAGHSATQPDESTGLQIGDVILELNGVPVHTIVKNVSKYYADSNEAALLRDVARFISRGACGELPLTVLRGSDRISVDAIRVSAKSVDLTADSHHDRPGDTFQMISNDVAYIKLSTIKAAAIPEYIERAASTKGLIVDIRNYPSDFVVYALTSHFVGRDTAFALNTLADLANPGSFRWGAREPIEPASPHYAGKLVILVDEDSQSQSEYTAMALRSVPGAMVIGSTTAGADGNTSPIPLPGGLRSLISGIGVFYPDKKPTQQVGIIPDIVVKPTLEGIRAGRDEVLEAAIREASSRLTGQ